MLDVFFTVDVEIWCDGWHDLDTKFPAAFREYVYGQTSQGEFGLRYQCQVLRDHGLRGMFFVEPLFSGRFGIEPLAEVVGLVGEGGQELQLHLHTEWIDEWPEPLLPGVRGKRQFMRDWSRNEQRVLIEEGLRRLELAQASRPGCLRAGSFGYNADTLEALRLAALTVDCSYNATAFGPSSGVAPGTVLHDTHDEHGVCVLPMTVYDTGFGRLRHAQLGACSAAELEGLLWAALEQRRRSFVLLSHNFELLAPSRQQPDPVVVARFRRLCHFLDHNRDCFRVRGLHGLPPPATGPQPSALRSSAWRSMRRIGEQLYRRRFA
jgi:hypothetical protein